MSTQFTSSKVTWFGDLIITEEIIMSVVHEKEKLKSDSTWLNHYILGEYYENQHYKKRV